MVKPAVQERRLWAMLCTVGLREHQSCLQMYVRADDYARNVDHEN